jgi:hypothetical protein
MPIIRLTYFHAKIRNPLLLRNKERRYVKGNDQTFTHGVSLPEKEKNYTAQ